MSENLNVIDELIYVPIGELSQYDADRLYELHRKVEADFVNARKHKDWIEMAISLKYEERIKAKRLRNQKDTGVIVIEDDGYLVQNNVPKRVEWDQRKLQTIIADLEAEGADIDALIQTSYSIWENSFKTWPVFLQNKFLPARTVKPGKTTTELRKADQTRGAL